MILCIAGGLKSYCQPQAKLRLCQPENPFNNIQQPSTFTNLLSCGYVAKGVYTIQAVHQ